MSADPVQNAYSVLSKVLKDGLGAAGHVQRIRLFSSSAALQLVCCWADSVATV